MGPYYGGDERYGSGLHNRRFGDSYLSATRKVCPNVAARSVGPAILFVDGQIAYLVHISNAPVPDPHT